jgi:hypothetical protein
MALVFSSVVLSRGRLGEDGLALLLARDPAIV